MWNTAGERTKKTYGGPRIKQPFQEEIKDGQMSFRKVVNISRHTKVTAQGRVFSASATVVLGNNKGCGGIGYGRGKDAAEAISVATLLAKRSIIILPRYQFTIPRGFEFDYRGCKLVVHSRASGKGLRGTLMLRELATAFGIEDLTAKVHGSRNPKKIAATFLHGLVRFAMLSPAQLAKYTGRKYVDWNNVWQQRPPPDDTMSNYLQDYETPVPPQSKFTKRDHINVADEFDIMDHLKPSKVPRNLIHGTLEKDWE